MDKEVETYLKNLIKSGEIVFVDGEKRWCERFHFDYKRRIIEVFGKEERRERVGIIPIEAVKEIIFKRR